MFLLIKNQKLKKNYTILQRIKKLIENIRLGINIDHVATLRNARGGKHPDIVKAAKMAENAAAKAGLSPAEIAATVVPDAGAAIASTPGAIVDGINKTIEFAEAQQEEYNAGVQQGMQDFNNSKTSETPTDSASNEGGDGQGGGRRRRRRRRTRRKKRRKSRKSRRRRRKSRKSRKKKRKRGGIRFGKSGTKGVGDVCVYHTGLGKAECLKGLACIKDKQDGGKYTCQESGNAWSLPHVNVPSYINGGTRRRTRRKKRRNRKKTRRRRRR